MTTKERLHWLIDHLSENEWAEAERVLTEIAAGDDPVLRALLNAPDDDEPETDEEREAVREAMARIASGEPGIPHDEVRRMVLDD